MGVRFSPRVVDDYIYLYIMFEFNIIFIGALTSKEHVFSARPWELDRIESIDYFDSLGSKIYVEVCDFKILRILPKIDDTLNIEWISNKVRFYYDSLKLQRLVSPVIRKFDGTYIMSNWFGVFLYLKNLKIFFFNSLENFFNLYFFTKIYVFANEDLDLLNLVSVKNLQLNFSYVIQLNYMVNESLNKLANIDFFHNFVCFPGNLKFFENFNIIYFFGYNLRCENPVLFMNLYLNKTIKLVCFGIPFLKNLSITSIGLTIKDFFKFIFFKKDFLSIRKFNFFFNKQLFIVGSSLLNRFDGFVYEQLFARLFFFFRYKYNIFCMIKYVYSNILVLNNIFLGSGFTFKSKYYKNGLKVKKNLNFSTFRNSNIYFFFIFNLFFFNNEMNFFIQSNYLNSNLSFFVYTGIQYNESLCLYDLYLPTTHLYERESLYYNLFAQKSVVKFIYSPMKLSKDLVDVYKYVVELYSIVTLKNLDQIKLHFKYNKLVKFKYLNINFIENYFSIDSFQYYLNNKLNMDSFLNLTKLENIYYDSFIFNKEYVDVYFVINSFFLYLHHNIYLTSDILKLSKLLVLAEDLNTKDIYYSNF